MLLDWKLGDFYLSKEGMIKVWLVYKIGKTHTHTPHQTIVDPPFLREGFKGFFPVKMATFIIIVEEKESFG